MASADFDFIGINEIKREYKSAITRACVCPFELLGKYIISALMASLGCVGVKVLSFPTGMFLYSTFLVAEHMIHALHILCIAFRA